MSERRERIIQALRDFADFLESHPAVPSPVGFTMNLFVDTTEELRAIARSATWTKHYSGDYFCLRRFFCEDFTLDVNINLVNINEHVSCRRIVTGTRVEPERIVDDVEWVCDDSAILGTPKAAS